MYEGGNTMFLDMETFAFSYICRDKRNPTCRAMRFTKGAIYCKWLFNCLPLVCVTLLLDYFSVLICYIFEQSWSLK